MPDTPIVRLSRVSSLAMVGATGKLAAGSANTSVLGVPTTVTGPVMAGLGATWLGVPAVGLPVPVSSFTSVNVTARGPPVAGNALLL